MEEISSFLDLMMDDASLLEDDEYVPESLASFVAEANKTLAAAKQIFLDENEDGGFSCANSIDSTATNLNRTVYMTEDEDDIRLKEELLDGFRSPSVTLRSTYDQVTSIDEPTTPRQGSAVKKLFDNTFSFEEEERALEREIASFFHVEESVVPKVSRPNLELSQKKSKNLDDTKLENAEKIKITEKPSSFWGNLTSSFTLTPSKSSTSLPSLNEGQACADLDGKGNISHDSRTVERISSKSMIPDATKNEKTLSVAIENSMKPILAMEGTSSQQYTQLKVMSPKSRVGIKDQSENLSLQSAGPENGRERSECMAGGEKTSVKEAEISMPSFNYSSEKRRIRLEGLEIKRVENGSALRSLTLRSPEQIHEARVVSAANISGAHLIVPSLHDENLKQSSRSYARKVEAKSDSISSMLQTSKFVTQSDTATNHTSAEASIKREVKPKQVSNEAKIEPQYANDYFQSSISESLLPDEMFLPNNTFPSVGNAEKEHLTTVVKKKPTIVKSSVKSDGQKSISTMKLIQGKPSNSSISSSFPSHNPRLLSGTSKKMVASTKTISKSFEHPIVNPSPPLVASSNTSSKLSSRQSSRRVTPMSSKTTLKVEERESKKEGISPEEALAKARERIRNRLKMEKKKSEETVAIARKLPIATATRAIRSSNKPNSTSVSSISKEPKKPSPVINEVKKAEEERRSYVAEKIRSMLSSTPKVLSQKQTNHVISERPPLAPTPLSKLGVENFKYSTPKPLSCHSHEQLHTNSRDESSSLSLAESVNEFMRKGLRQSHQTSTYDTRPKITTPKPFKFDELPPLPVTPAVSLEEKRKSSTMGEKLLDYNNHLRDSGPPIIVNRDEGPTMPVSPKFTPVPSREKPKSTIELETEMMEYYESHPFRAIRILTELPNSGKGVSGIPKVDKKKTTVPKPFRLSLETRGLQERMKSSPFKGGSDVEEPRQFKARPMPVFEVPSDDDSRARNIGLSTVDMPLRTLDNRHHKDNMTPIRASGSKLKSVLPKQFTSSLSNYSKTEKVSQNHVPSVIDIKQVPQTDPSPLSSPTATHSPNAMSKGRCSKSISNRDEEELKKQFKARPLPLSTFVSKASMTPSRISRIPNSICISSPPRLATQDRFEPREAAMLASRINVEILNRGRASIRQHKQEMKHKEDMKKACLPSPVKLKAASMTPFRLVTDARHKARVGTQNHKVGKK